MFSSLLDIPSNYYAGIYIRLSQEDKDKDKKYESDSESILNQRTMLKNYVEKNGFTFIDEYVDDGYSGTNFERPGFEKLIHDIETKRINLVIVKDLSRLGRDHVQTGYYMEKFFPEHNVRFISIMECYDSSKNQASNDSSTFIVACNDYYSKQNSNKILSVLNSKKIAGKFVGSMPSYGYMRDPEDKGHLIPDPKTAPVVKKIFKWYIEGVGSSEICTRLNEAGYPTPSGYKDLKHCSKLINSEDWSISSVNKILKNRIYTGDMVQSKQAKVNYKSKKKIALDPSRWIIVENTHEALVSKEDFNMIQNLPRRAPLVKTNREKRLIENLIYCKECGNTLTVSYKKNIDYWSVNCNRYARDPKRRKCEPHFFPYEYLEKEVLDVIIKTIESYIKSLDIKDLNAEVTRRLKLDKENKAIEVDYYKKRDKLIKKLNVLLDDRIEGRTTEYSYSLMKEPLEKELEIIKKEIVKIENKKVSKTQTEKRIPDYTKKIKELLNLDKPSRDLLFAIIEKIVIDKDSNVEIYFKYDLIEKQTFKYIGLQGPHNPNGRKGKKCNCAKS